MKEGSAGGRERTVEKERNVTFRHPQYFGFVV